MSSQNDYDHYRDDYDGGIVWVQDDHKEIR